MRFKKRELKQILSEIEAILLRTKSLEKKYRKRLESVHPANVLSAKNLVHYLALRASDVRALQHQLSRYGLSSLGRSERHIQATLMAVRAILKALLYGKKVRKISPPISVKKGKALLRRNAAALFGKRPHGSHIAVMVTLSSDAADDETLIRDLVAAGMSCARINCAHDDETIWRKMIAKVRAAEQELGQSCKVCMDMAGPKLRTGPMKQGEQVVHLSPVRDLYGRTVAPAIVYLSPAGVSIEPDMLPVESEWLSNLQENDTVCFTDTRGKAGKLKIEQKVGELWRAKCYDSAYLAAGVELILERSGKRTAVQTLPPREEKIILRVGDTLILHRSPVPGEPAEYDSEGGLVKAAHISCTLPEVFEQVKVGEPILFDDGAIEGVIRQVSSEALTIEITHTTSEVGKLRADKGINLPESNLRLSSLTPKDKEDLRFIVEHADLVSASFINSADDISLLIEELHRLDAPHLGIILKIETQNAFANLHEILLTAMQHYPIGMMIARGDLALEVGWENLASVQEELLRLGEAAHIPIIWATQVLETLAKKGRPSRAEISDAAMAERAEGVMLNKGTHILDTIQMLERIIKSMRPYQEKKTPLLPALQMAVESSLEE
ncbi:MAG: pyruvate kinase [Chloroherpetonaceae bacterium]|nr:pyruvate kinase [Chloroherpetonaceae bacterium]MCS7210649.1 pyruvate kinase [Chloroherpetonaceae bacterium]MDW8020914.1 pyruvate kinase [Chloroherpetonaceae bacterium]